MNKLSNKPTSMLALDVGSKRIGVARASSAAKLPQSLPTVVVDGHEMERIKQMIEEYEIDAIVIGWPRNLSGDETKQTKEIEDFEKQLQVFGLPIHRQDETLTSVQAERELAGRKRDKGAVDARAAVLILDDFLRSLR